MVINLQINLSRPNWTRNWSLRRKVIVFLAIALLLTPAAFVAASDTFSDVPDNNFAHAAINAIFGARITTGISPGIYGPGQNVTREQMAAFLQRGLPRLGYNQSFQSTLTNTYQDKGVVTINTGGAAGGTGFVKLDASLVAFNINPAGCPCELQFHILMDGGSSSPEYYATVYNESAGVDSNVTGSQTWAVFVPTATTQTFRLQVKQNSGTGVTSAGAITALYVPFGSTGAGTLSAQSIEGQDASEARDLKVQTTKGNN